MDATRDWTLTENSYVDTVINSAGISDTKVTNIIGNGYSVHYNSRISKNSYLGGKT
jgi:hypothetical protein